ncbi:flagellar hook-length control protein FliK [Antarctobacter sp.]|uniref:flagellar hook-length control protein FliK n=1 Tax=Antarctobacter sp. TaxID=1872577 RepID=UPI003A91C05A
MLSQLTSLLGLTPASRTPDTPKGDEPTIDFSSVFARAEDDRPPRFLDQGPSAEPSDADAPEAVLVVDTGEDGTLPDDMDVDLAAVGRSKSYADGAALAPEPDWTDEAGTSGDADPDPLPSGSVQEGRDHKLALTAAGVSAVAGTAPQTVTPDNHGDRGKPPVAPHGPTSPAMFDATAQGRPLDAPDDRPQTPRTSPIRHPGALDEQVLVDRESQLRNVRNDPVGLGTGAREDKRPVASATAPHADMPPAEAVRAAFVPADLTAAAKAKDPKDRLPPLPGAGGDRVSLLPKAVSPADPGLPKAALPDTVENPGSVETKTPKAVAQRDLPVFRMDLSTADLLPPGPSRGIVAGTVPLTRVTETAQGHSAPRATDLPNPVLDAPNRAPELKASVAASLKGAAPAPAKPAPPASAPPEAWTPASVKITQSPPLAPFDGPDNGARPDLDKAALTGNTFAIAGKIAVPDGIPRDGTSVAPRASTLFDGQIVETVDVALDGVALRPAPRPGAGPEPLQAAGPIAVPPPRAPLAAGADVRIIDTIVPETSNPPPAVGSSVVPSSPGPGPALDAAGQSGHLSGVSVLQTAGSDIRRADPIAKTDAVTATGPAEPVKIATRAEEARQARADRGIIRSERLAAPERYARRDLIPQAASGRSAKMTAQGPQAVGTVPRPGMTRVTAPLLADVLDDAPSAEAPVASPVAEARTFATLVTPVMAATTRTDTMATVRQVADGMARLSDGAVEIRLSPEELGHVRMQLVSADGGMTVHVSADRPETLDLLRRHIDQLARDLADAGYDGASFTFSEGDGGQRDGSPPTKEDGAIAGMEEQHPARNPVAPTAPDGLDLRF